MFYLSLIAFNFFFFSNFLFMQFIQMIKCNKCSCILFSFQPKLLLYFFIIFIKCSVNRTVILWKKKSLFSLMWKLFAFNREITFLLLLFCFFCACDCSYHLCSMAVTLSAWTNINKHFRKRLCSNPIGNVINAKPTN